MTERNITRLIKKYYANSRTPYMETPKLNTSKPLKQPGEIWSSESNYQQLKEYRNIQKFYLFDGLNNDYKLTGSQKLRARYLIFNLNFNDVNPGLSNEDIITMIALYVRIEYDPYRYHDYKYMLKNKGIKESTFITFLVGLNKNLASSN